MRKSARRGAGGFPDGQLKPIRLSVLLPLRAGVEPERLSVELAGGAQIQGFGAVILKDCLRAVRLDPHKAVFRRDQGAAVAVRP